MGRTYKNLAAFYLPILLGILLCIFAGSSAITTIAETSPVQRTHCFIIDPGHGGVDGGATSCTGRLESAYNLEIAVRLNDLLNFLGHSTRMIRTEDISIYTTGETIAQKKISDLKERVRICNETEGAILLSIHQNNFTDSRYSGPQIFYGTSDGSESLAKLMQGSLNHSLKPDSKRSPKKAKGIYLMEHIQCPGVLIECGFLSNPQEEAKLRSEEYQKILCCILAATAVSFINA